MATGTELYEQMMRYLFVAAGARSEHAPFRFADRVHWLDLPGRGPLGPLVLVHGFSASGASQYGPLARLLRPHVSRIVLPDLPGHGSSTVPASGLDAEVMIDALVAAMDAALGEPAVMFASSMAGGVAVHYALRRPQALRGLVLCSPSGAPFAPDEVPAFSRIFKLDSHREALEFVDRLLPAAATAPAGSRPPGPQLSPLRHATAWGVRQQFNRPHLVSFIERAPRFPSLEPDHLASLGMPVYLIWGRGDDILPPSHFEFYRANLPAESEIETPPHFGHAPFLHHPGELADRLLSFMRRLPS